jgi:hypothetical protein
MVEPPIIKQIFFILKKIEIKILNKIETKQRNK